jgi:hypothetical protein
VTESGMMKIFFPLTIVVDSVVVSRLEHPLKAFALIVVIVERRIKALDEDSSTDNVFPLLTRDVQPENALALIYLIFVLWFWKAITKLSLSVWLNYAAYL